MDFSCLISQYSAIFSLVYLGVVISSWNHLKTCVSLSQFWSSPAPITASCYINRILVMFTWFTPKSTELDLLFWKWGWSLIVFSLCFHHVPALQIKYQSCHCCQVHTVTNKSCDWWLKCVFLGWAMELIHPPTYQDASKNACFKLIKKTFFSGWTHVPCGVLNAILNARCRDSKGSCGRSELWCSLFMM